MLSGGNYIKMTLYAIELYLDLNLNTRGELELHQSVDSLGGRAVDVDQTLVV